MISFGKASFGSALELDGSASIGLQVTFEPVTTPQGTKTIQFIATLNGTANVAVHTMATATLPAVKVQIAHLGGKSFPFKVGPIQLYVKPTIDLYSTADGQIQAGIDAAVTGASSIGPEIDYTEGNGWSFTPINNQTLTVKPTFSANAQAIFHVTPIHADISLIVDEVVGPYVNGDYPQFTFKLQAQTSSPSGPPLEIDADFQGTVGIYLPKLLPLPDFSKPFHFHFVLYPGGPLLGITGVGSNMSALFRADPNSGIASSAVTFPGHYGGGAIDAANHLLYVTVGYDGSTNLGDQLVVIDLQADSVTRTVNTSYSGNLVYDPGKQRLLGITGGSTGSTLLTIDPNTGAVTNAVTFPGYYLSLSSDAIDAAHHLLYVCVDVGSDNQPAYQLVVIDLQTDSVIRTVNTKGLSWLGYDTGTMKLFGILSPQSVYQLAVVDPNTGAASSTALILGRPGSNMQTIDPINHLLYVEGSNTNDPSDTQLMVFDLKTGLLIRTVNVQGFEWLGFDSGQGGTN